jgi:hypothetical protein
MKVYVYYLLQGSNRYLIFPRFHLIISFFHTSDQEILFLTVVR